MANEGIIGSVFSKALFKKISLVAALLLFLTGNLRAEPENSSLTVILPQVRPPFDRVFAEILQGIQDEVNGHARSIVINDKSTSDELNALIQKGPPGPLIGLGNQAKKLLEPLNRQYRIIYGATFLNPDKDEKGIEGISLTPSPTMTFKWLRTLTPEIRSVHVVFETDYNGWLIRLAKTAAKKQGLTLIEHPVVDVRQAANEFRKILNHANPATDAIWLMQRDPTLDEQAIVPDILAQAWNNNFVIFSSNPAHVPRGALFALYPDNEKMGNRLAKLALEPADPGDPGIVPLKDLHIAVNVRTASHVGKNFSRREEKQFDLIFPDR